MILNKGYLFLLVAFSLLSDISYGTLPDSVGFQQLRGSSFLIYEVDSGETLFSISQRYACRIVDIMDVNNLADEYTLSLGQLLFVPSGKSQSIRRAEKRDPEENGMNLHYVKKGESLYSIAREYQVDFEQLMVINPEVVDYTVKPGQKVRIPNQKKIYPDKQYLPENALVHKVQAGETVYSISRSYGGLDINQVRDWNKLSGDTIREGQALIIGWMARQAFIDDGRKNIIVLPNKPESVIPATVPDNSEERTIPEANAEESIKPRPASESMAPQPELRPAMAEKPSFDQMYEGYDKGLIKDHKGIATWMKDDIGYGSAASRFYALHDLAPVGSVIRVTNLMNNRVIYAKVIGDLPKNKEDEKSIVKLSNTAAKELRVLDDRFLVKADYLQR